MKMSDKTIVDIMAIVAIFVLLGILTIPFWGNGVLWNKIEHQSPNNTKCEVKPSTEK